MSVSILDIAIPGPLDVSQVCLKLAIIRPLDVSRKVKFPILTITCQ